MVPSPHDDQLSPGYQGQLSWPPASGQGVLLDTCPSPFRDQRPAAQRSRAELLCTLLPPFFPSPVVSGVPGVRCHGKLVLSLQRLLGTSPPEGEDAVVTTATAWGSPADLLAPCAPTMATIRSYVSSRGHEAIQLREGKWSA